MSNASAESRDPDRIDDVLAAVRAVWMDDPDLRLAQLIVNAANLAGRDVVSPALYSLEDDDLTSGLEEYRRLRRE